jgi:hypothetical protein
MRTMERAGVAIVPRAALRREHTDQRLPIKKTHQKLMKNSWAHKYLR